MNQPPKLPPTHQPTKQTTKTENRKRQSPRKQKQKAIERLQNEAKTSKNLKDLNDFITCKET